MPSGETTAADERVTRHTIEIRLRDQPAALDRLVGMLRHRRFSVESITLHATIERMSRITLVLQTADPSIVLERICRLVDVFDVNVLESTTPAAPTGQPSVTPQSSGEHDGKIVL